MYDWTNWLTIWTKIWKIISFAIISLVIQSSLLYIFDVTFFEFYILIITIINRLASLVYTACLHFSSISLILSRILKMNSFWIHQNSMLSWKNIERIFNNNMFEWKHYNVHLYFRSFRFLFLKRNRFTSK